MAHQHSKQPACANCHYVFVAGEPDEFCPRCGQQNHEVNIGFGHVIEEFLEGVFHFDGKVFRTAGLLLFKPGQLTKRFFEGHRTPYVPPIRLYVFISFVFFALLALLRGHSDNDKRRLTDFTPEKSEKVFTYRGASAADSVAHVRDSVLTTIRQQLQADFSDTSVQKQKNTGASFNITGLRISLADIKRLPEHASDTQLDSVITANDGVPGAFKRQGLRAMVRWRGATREEAIHQAIRAASILLFLLMPLAALLLKGAYFRQHRHYVSHLIFTVHVHCFLFVFIALMLLLEKIHLPQEFNKVSLGLPAMYFVVALRTFYQQAWGKTLLKSLLLSVAYFFTLLVAGVLVSFGGLLYF